MKIYLINPPIVLNKDIGQPYAFQPLGLLYVASALENKYNVKILDASIEGWRSMKEDSGYIRMGIGFEEIFDRIKSFMPDIVGITVPFSLNSASAFKVASVVKDVSKDIITVLGGTHPTVRPIETLLNNDIDFIVLGEGEETFKELIDTLNKEGDRELEKINGIGYKKNGEPIINDRRPWLKDLDNIPFPARHLLPIEEYFAAAKAGRGSRKINTFHERWADIITTRGCPYNCNFCSIHETMGKVLRKRSPEDVICEIEHLVKNYNIRHINFEDDNLTLDKAHAGKIFDLIIERKLNITWSAPNGIRADAISERLASKMARSGCKRVFVAPESGSQEVLSRIIGKNLDLRSVEKALKILRRYKIIVDGSFVIGLIGESLRDIRKTLIYAFKLKLLGMNTAGVHIATPYYGTRLYKEAVEKNYLRSDLDDSMFNTSTALISTSQWSKDDMLRYRKFAIWLLNYGLKERVAYILINYLPFIWGMLKFLKKFCKTIIFIPIGLFKKASFWLRLFKNSICSALYQKVSKLPRIDYLVYEITDVCNSRCKHCNIWQNRPSPEVLTALDVNKILSDDCFKNLKSVLITGGEPVLKNDLKEIMLAVHRARPQAKMTLSTNAILPDKVIETVKFAVANNILLSVGISLDAIGQRHDRIRGIEGNFSKAEYLINELIKLRDRHRELVLGIVAGHTLSSITRDTLAEVHDYAISKGIYFLTQLYEEFAFYGNVDKGKENDIDSYLEGKNRELIKELEKLPISFHNEVLIRALKHRLKYKCASMKTFFVLRCDGTISPCLKYTDMKIAGLKDRMLSAIWGSSDMKAARKVAANCTGCSNSWAVDWSFINWCFPFLKISFILAVKKFFYRIRKRRIDA